MWTLTCGVKCKPQIIRGGSVSVPKDTSEECFSVYIEMKLCKVFSEQKQHITSLRPMTTNKTEQHWPSFHKWFPLFPVPCWAAGSQSTQLSCLSVSFLFYSPAAWVPHPSLPPPRHLAAWQPVHWGLLARQPVRELHNIKPKLNQNWTKKKRAAGQSWSS